jgi:hypothetical protein
LFKVKPLEQGIERVHGLNALLFVLYAMSKKSGGPTKWAYLMRVLLAFFIRYQTKPRLLHVFGGHLILMDVPPVREEDGSYTYSS